MQSISQSIWWPRLAALALAGLAAASATYWVLKLPPGDLTAAPAMPAATEAAPADPLALARALGGGDTPVALTLASAAVVNVSSRLALMGVVANTRHGGTALISVDGKPARPFAVGARVDDNLVLQSVAPRRAVLASGSDSPASLTLDLPLLSK